MPGVEEELSSVEEEDEEVVVLRRVPCGMVVQAEEFWQQEAAEGPQQNLMVLVDWSRLAGQGTRGMAGLAGLGSASTVSRGDSSSAGAEWLREGAHRCSRGRTACRARPRPCRCSLAAS
jgi:hypothetical protein